MKHILFDAVFHAPSESVIKKMEDIFFDTVLIESRPAVAIILETQFQKIHFWGPNVLSKQMSCIEIDREKHSLSFETSQWKIARTMAEKLEKYDQNEKNRYFDVNHCKISPLLEGLCFEILSDWAENLDL
jgi:hypothetical protein